MNISLSKVKIKTIAASILLILTMNHKNSVAKPPTNPKIPNIQEHSLNGKWNWVFLDTGASHKMLINSVQHYETHSNASGTIESLEEQCPVTLTVYNTAKTQLISNNGNTNIAHDGQVIIDIKCKNATVLAMGYGLPSKIGSIVGRSDIKVGDSKIMKQPFVISRAE